MPFSRFPNDQRGNLLNQEVRCDIMRDLEPESLSQKNITELPLTYESIRYDCENVWASPTYDGM